MGERDRARYAAELAAQMHIATGDARSSYYALTQVCVDCSRHDGRAWPAAFDSARRLEEPSWPGRLLRRALAEATLLMSNGRHEEAKVCHLYGLERRADDERAAGAAP